MILTTDLRLGKGILCTAGSESPVPRWAHLLCSVLWLHTIQIVLRTPSVNSESDSDVK